MPIFEYLCSSCGARFEKLQRSTETGTPPCPTCGSPEVGKLISSFAPTSAGASSHSGCAPVG